MFIKQPLPVCLLLAAMVAFPRLGASQSTSATVFGTVTDEQQNALSGVTITLRRFDTGESRTATTDERGSYRIVGLAPGRYEVHATSLILQNDQNRGEIILGLNEEIAIPLVMRRGICDCVRVAVEAPIGSVPLTTVGRGFTTAEIEELPVSGRDITSLALLSPGISAMAGTMRTTAAGIAAAGQNGRNNTFLIDGLSIDDNRLSNVRGTLSLDAISEFTVLSNAFRAEYGQASGAVISLLTRSPRTRTRAVPSTTIAMTAGMPRRERRIWCRRQRPNRSCSSRSAADSSAARYGATRCSSSDRLNRRFATPNNSSPRRCCRCSGPVR